MRTMQCTISTEKICSEIVSPSSLQRDLNVEPAVDLSTTVVTNVVTMMITVAMDVDPVVAAVVHGIVVIVVVAIRSTYVNNTPVTSTVLRCAQSGRSASRISRRVSRGRI